MSEALTPVGFYHCTRSRPFDVVPVLAGKAVEAGHRVLVVQAHGVARDQFLLQIGERAARVRDEQPASADRDGQRSADRRPSRPPQPPPNRDLLL